MYPPSETGKKSTPIDSIPSRTQENSMKRNSFPAAALALLGFVAALVCTRPVQAQDAKSPYPGMAPVEQYLMDRNAEITLARTAAPASISDGAEVMVLGREGYETAVKGTNGFDCLVERSWGQGTNEAEFWNPKMRAPHCFNAQATRSFAQIYLMKTKLVMAGKSKAEIGQAIVKAFDGREIPALEPGAMAYMMSKQQYLNDRAANWHSHAMFFFAGDMAKSWAANDPGSPVVMAGDPEERVTILFVLADKWSDGTASSMTMP
jgi:hypothetical protein